MAFNQGYISITFAGLTVTFWSFNGDRYPRIYAEGPIYERTASGNLAISGPAIEDPHLWEFKAKVSQLDARKLRAMYNKAQLRRRRDQLTPLLVVDTTQPFEEEAPRTRALAPSPYNVVEVLENGDLSYYGQYNTIFSQRLEINETGASIFASVSMIETEQKVAA